MRRITLLTCVAAVLGLSACGGSSNGNASSLLKQTFSGSHTVNSGNLAFSLTVNPSGSTTLTAPITLSFGGPFQSQGQGKLPKSNFNVSLNAGGKSAGLGILSTGTAGFVTLQGTSYQLPAATFQKLESSFAGLTSSPSSSSGSTTLSKLGIHPLQWLKNPSVVGDETVGGTKTTHIRAGVNVPALLADVSTVLGKASSLGAGSAGAPSSLSLATRQKIASAVQNPTFDVWTGASDKTVRRLSIKLTLPVTGQASTLLGGMSSAQIGLSMQYADLNQPQTISAPTNVRPFTEFSAKLKSFLSALQSTVTGGATGSLGSPSAGTGTTTTPSTSATSTTGAGSNVQQYGQCIVNAHNDISKMQKCAALINK
jgi:hypothetical protein